MPMPIVAKGVALQNLNQFQQAIDAYGQRH